MHGLLTRINELQVILLLSAIGFQNQPLHAQDTGIPKYVEVMNTMGEAFQYAFQINPEGRYREIKGSPYLFDEWRPGTILLKGDSIESHFSMRYNMYGNEMQFIYREDTLVIANPLAIDEIRINNRKFYYLPFYYGDNFNMSFFEVLADGPVRLFLRRESKLRSGTQPVTPYHCQNAYDRFVTKSYYYYQLEGDEEPRMLPRSRGELSRLDTFKDYRAWIRQNHIRVRHEKDLIALFHYINQTIHEKEKTIPAVDLTAHFLDFNERMP